MFLRAVDLLSSALFINPIQVTAILNNSSAVSKLTERPHKTHKDTTVNCSRETDTSSRGPSLQGRFGGFLPGS